jgi:hypothetical protein
MKTTKIQGELEIDHERGVIYFHTSDGKHFPTPLRICRLGKIPQKFETIDITHMKGIHVDIEMSECHGLDLGVPEEDTTIVIKYPKTSLLQQAVYKQMLGRVWRSPTIKTKDVKPLLEKKLKKLKTL